LSAASTSWRRRFIRCASQRASRPSRAPFGSLVRPGRGELMPARVPCTRRIGYSRYRITRPSPWTPQRPFRRAMSDQTLRDAVIVGGNRIPFGKAGGAYAAASNQSMLTAALDGLVARFGLAGQQIGEVAAGAVLKHSRDFNLTR